MINIEVEYHSDRDWENVDWDAVRDHWPVELPEEKPEDKYTAFTYGNDKVRLTYEEATLLSTSRLKMLILPSSTSTQLSKMRTTDRWKHSNEINPKDLMTGDAVQIHIADLGLLHIDEVTYLDSACTDNLQGHLDEGWKILAVCPPVASRRPDYILGRKKQ